MINLEKNAFAFCPGIRGNSIAGNFEHLCIGSTADNVYEDYCGDFSAFFDGYGSYSTNPILFNTTFLIFYR